MYPTSEVATTPSRIEAYNQVMNIKTTLILIAIFSSIWIVSRLLMVSSPTSITTDNMATDQILPTDFSILVPATHKPESSLSQSDTDAIISIIDKFQKYKYFRDPVSAIGMITSPTTSDESGWLDHFLGTDLPMGPSRDNHRFNNIDKYHLLVGYNINQIRHIADTYYATVTELRVLLSGAPGEKYRLTSPELLFELVSDKSGFNIVRYYHSHHTRPDSQKYNGFISE
jgi:hypothetical protein